MATNLNSLLGGGGGGAGWKPESQTALSFTPNTTGLKANITAPSGKLIRVIVIASQATSGSSTPKITVTVDGNNLITNDYTFGNTTFPGVNGQVKNNWPAISGVDYSFRKSYNEIFATSLQVSVTTASGSTAHWVVYEIGEFI